MKAITRAICLCGGPAMLARHLGVTVQAVCFWRDGKREFPADRCPDIEEATNGQVTCEDLRPDVNWAVLRGTKVVDPPPDAARKKRRTPDPDKETEVVPVSGG